MKNKILFAIITVSIILATFNSCISTSKDSVEIAVIEVKPIPTKEFDEVLSYNFNEDIENWGVASDSGSQPDITLDKAESNALMFNISWGDKPDSDRWSDSVRVKADGVNLNANGANAIAFDLYIESGKTVEIPFEVVPILQYPPSWWVQGPSITFDYSNGNDLGNGLVKYSIVAEINELTGDEVINHLLINVIGNGTGYEGKVLLDNIALVTTK